MPSLLDLFSGGASNAIQKGGDAYRDWINWGYNTSNDILDQTYRDRTRADLAYGNSQAMDYLSQARDPLLAARDQGQYIADALNAIGVNNAGLERITGYYQPYLDAGNKASGLYQTYLGMNGADAARQAFDNFTYNNPGVQYQIEQAQKANLARLNAAGAGNSGRADLANSRVAQELTSSNVENYLNRLGGLQQQGMSAAGALGQFTDANSARNAGVYTNLGTQIANVEGGHGQRLMGLYQNTGNALSGLLGNKAQQAANYGQQQAAAGTQYGLNKGNLAFNVAQMQGGNAANTLTNRASANTGAINNLFSLGSTAMSAATGMPMSFGGGNSGSSFTTPGTAANGGWSTTTTPAGSNNLGSLVSGLFNWS
jgi:hypothetical protein